MIHIRRSSALLLFFPLLIAAAEPRDIASKDIATVLHEGVQVRIGTLAKRVVIGKLTSVTADSVGVQTGAQETHVPVKEIDWFRVTAITESNKRTWLPLILCATVGTASFVAAGATEEKKSAYLPIAAGVTAALGIGGYYGGRALDRQEITYRIR